MIIRAIVFFLVLLISVLIGIQLQHDPGYFLIEINHWTIESTLWVALIAFALLFVIFHMILLTCHWLLNFPKSWRDWLMERRIQKAHLKTQQGLIEFGEGYWLKAKNHLINALPDADMPLLNYLTAARAAQEMGDNELRDNYLQQAEQSMPEAKIAVGLTQAELQLANHQWEQALATLKHLQDIAPRHPSVLRLLMNLYEDVEDWPQLIALLPELKRSHVLSGVAFLRMQQNAYFQAMLVLIKQNQAQELIEFIAKLPKNVMNDVELIGEYSRYLLQNQKDRQAELLLRRCLRKEFNERLIDLYGQMKSGEDQLTFAESLLKNNPHSAALFLCLGRLSKNKHLWGKAKTYFEQSIALHATPVVYAELGSLQELLNDHVGACEAYRQGLLLAVHAIGDHFS